MISMIRGTLAFLEEGKVFIDTGAIGFEVNVPASFLDRLPHIGSEIRLYTYLHVKEDEMSLFGFETRDQLQMFRQLIAVSGIGPKGALGILSFMTPSDIRFAVLASDTRTLSKAPGIGKKTAERLIIELKDKVSAEDGLSHLNDVSSLSAANGAEENGAKTEAMLALTALGYSSSEALRALSELDLSDKTVEEILKEALKRMKG